MTARRIGLRRCGPAALLGSVALIFTTGWATGQSPTTGLSATDTFRSEVAIEDGLFQFPNHAQAADAGLRLAESLFARAQSEQREGRLADANVSLSVLLSTYPHHELARTARLMRASVRYDLRLYDEALHDVRTVLATRPPRAVQSDALLVRGMCQAALDRPAEAIQTFESIANDDPTYSATDRVLYELAWAYTATAQPERATATFQRLATSCPASPLAADARIMVAESRFAVRDYAAAFEHFETALEQNAGSRELRGVALLHAAQAANQLDKWTASLDFLERCEREFPDNRWTAEIRCEWGWALYHQEQLDAAWVEFEFVANARGDALGARSRFMLGEIQFARKQYDAAVRTFFQVAYGYGGTEAPPAIRRWQSEATFEAARCLEQTRRHESARKLYRELLTYYPECAKAAHARLALDGLKRR